MHTHIVQDIRWHILRIYELGYGSAHIPAGSESRCADGAMMSAHAIGKHGLKSATRKWLKGKKLRARAGVPAARWTQRHADA